MVYITYTKAMRDFPNIYAQTQGLHGITIEYISMLLVANYSFTHLYEYLHIHVSISCAQVKQAQQVLLV